MAIYSVLLNNKELKEKLLNMGANPYIKDVHNQSPIEMEQIDLNLNDMAVLERDKTSKENVLQIIQNQLPEEQKIRLATYVIENENLEKTYELIDILIKKLNNI